MRRVMLGIGLGSALLAGQVSAENLNLRQCLSLALSQNPELMATNAKITQAQAAIDQASSSYLPKLTASITASRSNDPLNVFGMKLMQQSATFNDFGAGEFTGPSSLTTAPKNLNHPSDYSNINTRLEAQMPVYTGGKLDAYLRQAKSYLAAAQAGDQAAQQQLMFMVIQTFEGIDTAEAFADVAEKGVKAAESFVKTAENLSAQGVLVKSELLSAKVHLSNVQVQRDQAYNQRDIAMEQLKMLMGMSLDTPLSLIKGAGVAACECDLARAKEKALRNNPQLRAVRQQAEAAGSALDAAKADYLPTVGLLARQDWNDDTLALNHNSYLIAGSLSWTLTDFGVTKAGVDRARATQGELKSQVKKAENEVDFKVSEAFRKANEAQKRAIALQLNVEQADEASRLVKQRHEGGVATITEVLVAETQKLKAQADLIAARQEGNLQRALLRVLTGELSESMF